MGFSLYSLITNENSYHAQYEHITKGNCYHTKKEPKLMRIFTLSVKDASILTFTTLSQWKTAGS